MTMLIAGHETTAAVLTWAVFLLAQVCYPYIMSDCWIFMIDKSGLLVVMNSFNEMEALSGMQHHLDAYQFAYCRILPN